MDTCSATSYISEYSEAKETQSLLQKAGTNQLQDWRRKCACLLQNKYRLPVISEKGAIVMIVWNLFFSISLFTCNIFAEYTGSTRIVVVTITSSMVLYPLIGWLADTRLGNFKVICAALYLLLIAIVLKNVAIFILPSKYILYSSLLVWSVSGACYLSCIIPFATDQSVGASAEELSFTFHWLSWGCCTGYCIATITSLLTGEYQVFSQFLLTLISFVIAFVWLEACQRHTFTKPVISNPIKLIAQVLNYAHKHKYPERCSALTYWEEDCPTRLDLGKEKYGGPFTFEEVENVKTFLRLIPLLVCISIFHMEFWAQNMFFDYFSNCSSNNMIFFRFPSHYQLFYPCLITFVGLPVYYFLIFPLFHKYVLTIIRRIGAGMFLMVLTFLVCAIAQLLELTQFTNSANVTCILSTTMSNNCPTSYNLIWILAPELSKSLGYITIVCGMYELIIAQTPHEIKSLLLCISTGIGGIFVVSSFALHKLLTSFPIYLYPGCLFYYYICYFTLGTLAFILYVLVAKWYNLRIRDDIVPYHMIAEQHFERELANRSAYIQAQQLECSDEEYWRQ